MKSSMHNGKIALRRAIEGLRAGVPNTDVVTQLPPIQDTVEDSFNELLNLTENSFESGKQAQGLLLKGEFGTGKSHWLEYFEHLAMERNFVLSRVVLNKETPLYDITKIYRACVLSARVKGKIGPALDEITAVYDRNRAPLYHEFSKWAETAKDLDPRFPATLYLIEKNPSDDLREKIILEWTGYPMKVREIKDSLKAIGEQHSYIVAAPLKGKLIQRFEFLSRFFRSAGYNGWVVLIDETEMISRYSTRQRGRAYANLARIYGKVKEINIPGLASVFTITKDYAGIVLRGDRRYDKETIPDKLKGTRDEEHIPAAKEGMKIIEQHGVPLIQPNREQLNDIYLKVRDLYSKAYSWQAPDLEKTLEWAQTTRMRQYIRSWVNQWDFWRLYGHAGKVVIDDVAQSYEEDIAFQVETDRNQAVY